MISRPGPGRLRDIIGSRFECLIDSRDDVGLVILRQFRTTSVSFMYICRKVWLAHR
jgi:hypothetical protein